MQELVEDLRGDRLHRVPLLVGELCGGLVELGGADRFGAGAKRSNRRHDVEGCLSCAEPLRLFRDDCFRPLGLAPTAGETRSDDRFELVDVVEAAATEVV